MPKTLYAALFAGLFLLAGVSVPLLSVSQAEPKPTPVSALPVVPTLHIPEQLGFEVPNKLWDLKPPFSPHLTVACDVDAIGRTKHIVLQSSSGNADVDKLALQMVSNLYPSYTLKGTKTRHYLFSCVAFRPSLPLVFSRNVPTPFPAAIHLPKMGFGIPSNFWGIASHDIVVSFDVGADGKPKNLVLKQFSGNDAVDKLAMEAVRKLHLPPQWHEPANRHLTYLCEGFMQ